MKTIKELKNAIETKKARSAWSKGVQLYAYELIEELEQNENDQFFGSSSDRKMLLNGARDWKTYSYGGCALIYDQQIAKRLCTTSELKTTRNGERQPNARETWLDCQARALYQAEVLILELCK
jgi:hypothetical protein